MHHSLTENNNHFLHLTDVDLQVLFKKRDARQRSVLYSGITLWNRFPTTLTFSISKQLPPQCHCPGGVETVTVSVLEAYSY